ncbi:MAG TPA: M23 family metallopeptidase [Anaerolineales bacterium]|nr:M23 family metallopeptidase [Anaerolineales bacterium]
MALDYQILLLPRKDYWTWLQACQDYVLTFGANLTPEPQVAGGYMRPRQVISFPYFEGAFPEIGDPVRWFQKNFDGVRLDPIDSDDPVELRKDLRRRIEDNDRYGARQRPFHLVWPTDFPVVTQAFGANPQAYRRYGMPGHEGLDFRALTNTNIYACADGEIYEVGTWKKHAYGIHVRIQHRDGYKTVYAHLARALVRKGDVVRAGQRIGLADSTGNSSGAHLHMSLKRDGATARKETVYPKDIIDPTSFMVWPAAKQRPGAKSKMAIGLNLAGGDAPTQAEIIALGRVGAEAVLLPSSVSGEALSQVRQAAPGVRVIARVGQPATPQAARFVSQVAGEVGRLVRAGVQDFECGAFANEVQGGFGSAWRHGGEFGEWLDGVVTRLREIFPQIRLGFPSLAAGPNVDGRQAAAEEFLLQAEAAVEGADWVGASVMLSNGTPTGSTIAHFIAANFPGKPIVVTGADDAEEGVAAETRAIAFRALAESLSGATATVLFGGLHAGENPAAQSWEAAKIAAGMHM